MNTIRDNIKSVAKIDILAKGRIQKNFIGRPFYIDYSKVNILTCDAWKHQAGGIPQGSFLLAFYDGEEGVEEALLLRAIGPTNLPTDSDNIRSMVAYYKDNIEIAGRAGVENKNSKLDQFTKFEFSCSGLECRILGVFYRTTKIVDNKKIAITEFGADVENFYSANNYKVYKATEGVLKEIVNRRGDDDIIAGNKGEFKIGKVRYSSSRRFQNNNKDVNVFVSPKDFLGKRTALFGMTRTGKSNTVKKLIQATVEISVNSEGNLTKDTELVKAKKKSASENVSDHQVKLFSTKEISDDYFREMTEHFVNEGYPRYSAGQIIFDVNGEYANANMQDEGTAVFELYENDVIRYSVLEKEGFKVMKVNFYSDIESGFDLIKSSLLDEKGDYIKSFLAIDLTTPENYNLAINKKTSDEKKASYVYDRKKAIYLACLYLAKFPLPPNLGKIRFYGCTKTINKLSPQIKPHEGITLDETVQWFTTLYEASGTEEGKNLLKKYKEDKKKDYLDEDMKAMLVFLTRKLSPTSKNATLSGYRKLRSLIDLHTPFSETSFEIEILKHLRKGKIVIIDLSQGNPTIQKLYSEKITTQIFKDSMARFIESFPNNFIQFYFEEAHNLFPKKDDKDLSQIYNRIAKEGAKLNLGMIYATQEVSSISANILKNTQNWFIAHLNNEDELKEIRKYYDFSDFTDSLVRFSAGNDKGFVRMKTYTNPFVVPVQIDRFLADQKNQGNGNN